MSESQSSPTQQQQKGTKKEKGPSLAGAQTGNSVADAPSHQQQQKPPRGEGKPRQEQGKGQQEKKGNQEKGGPDGGKGPQERKQGGHQQSGAGGKSSNQSSAQQANKSAPPVRAPRLALFDHLPRKVTAPSVPEGESAIHPATLKLGLLYRKGAIQADDDRVAALLASFMKVIENYKTPPNKTLSWDLDKYIRTQVQHLVDSRQLCTGMGNLIKYIRYQISHISPELNEADAKSYLLSKIYAFLEERIVLARESIARYCESTIKDNDVILTFGSSPLLRQVLLSAATTKKFRLIVVDTRPLNEGLRTLSSLSPHVHCVYTPLSGAASIMREATRVILGASALLSNGAMLAPAGTAMIAALAKMQRIPVIVACESYKFTEKVQLDSIVNNELGAASEVAVVKGGSSGGSGEGGGAGDANAAAGESEPGPQLSIGYRGAAEKLGADGSEGNLPFQVVNLRYDLTPIGNIAVIATETGLIPPTSIPLLIKELRSDEGSGEAGGPEGGN